MLMQLVPTSVFQEEIVPCPACLAMTYDRILGEKFYHFRNLTSCRSQIEGHSNKKESPS